MNISMTVDAEFQVSKYSFHLQDADGTLIWRKDNVHQHRGLTGKEHIHRPARGVDDFPAVDLEEALHEAADYVERGVLP